MVSTARQALGQALQCLPALVLGMLCLRAADLLSAPGGWRLAGPALLNDVVALLRYGWLALLLAFAALLAGGRAGRWTVGALWSLLLLLQALLIQYHASASVPLGADLFAYSWSEIVTTAHGGSLSALAAGGALLALAAMWTLLLRGSRRAVQAGPLALAASALLLAAAPLTRPQAGGSAPSAAYNKSAFFLDDTLRWLRGGDAAGSAAAAADPDYPFLRPERTPDTLGAHFALEPTPPNIVIMIVEGLGRSFSGPGARLGSFTPFLDELGARSLYFENFVAPQGRTFGVLPSILGSLPFGAGGFAALGGELPEHQALPALLARHGYASRFYTGSNLEFDNEGGYLRRAGVDTLVSQRDFPPGLRTSSEWGYGDHQLIDVALRREQNHPSGPSLVIVQTSSMHTPYAFPGKERYLDALERRLDALGIAQAAREPYRRQREIYASILYADQALRTFFEGASRLPGHANTIYLVTGDHRLPEIPMDTRLERYHVPLLIHSPLLKGPARIKSISSHFDIAPSLLAMLANRYALALPLRVTWLGTGLDLEPDFRNVHAFALKQTKTEPSDFISGTTYLAQDRLYAITDGLQIEPLDSAGARAQANAQLQAFNAANQVLIRSRRLLPPQALEESAPYGGAGRSLAAASVAAQSGDLYVSATRVRRAPNGDLLVASSFVNRAARPTPLFVPLLVVSDDKGRELAEAYGKAARLAAGATTTVELAVPRARLGAAAPLFASMIPSDPDDGKPLGTGQYHVSAQP